MMRCMNSSKIGDFSPIKKTICKHKKLQNIEEYGKIEVYDNFLF